VHHHLVRCQDLNQVDQTCCLFFPFPLPLLLLPCRCTDLAAALPLPLPPLKLPLVDALVTLCLAGGMLSLAAATKAFSGKGPRNLLIGTCSLSPAEEVCNYLGKLNE
jgi:hypothetical protein